MAAGLYTEKKKNKKLKMCIDCRYKECKPGCLCHDKNKISEKVYILYMKYGGLNV